MTPVTTYGLKCAMMKFYNRERGLKAFDSIRKAIFLPNSFLI